ncbi:MAG: hypothetical protein GY765_21045 [bacterium]|nr:hypothetical protein [bacterium]
MSSDAIRTINYFEPVASLIGLTAPVEGNPQKTAAPVHTGGGSCSRSTLSFITPIMAETD